MFAVLGVFWPVPAQIRLFGCTRGRAHPQTAAWLTACLGAVAAGGGWPLLLGGPGRGSGMWKAACAVGGFPGRAGRRGRRCAGRWPVPAAGTPRRGWGCRRGGGCCRCLPGRGLPPWARRGHGRWPASGCASRGPGWWPGSGSLARQACSALRAWPSRLPRSRNSSMARWCLAAGALWSPVSCCTMPRSLRTQAW